MTKKISKLIGCILLIDYGYLKPYNHIGKKPNEYRFEEWIEIEDEDELEIVSLEPDT